MIIQISILWMVNYIVLCVCVCVVLNMVDAIAAAVAFTSDKLIASVLASIY